MLQEQTFCGCLSAVLVTGVGALAQLACTTTLYEGPTISSSAAATIESVDHTTIKEIDGKDVTTVGGGGSVRYLVPPGPHILRVGVQANPSIDTELCLVGDRGRVYRTVTPPSSIPAIVEIKNGDEEGRPVDAVNVSTDCVPERLFPSRPDTATGSVKEEVIQLWSAAEIAQHIRRRPFVDVSFAMTWAGGGDEVAWAQRTDGTRDSIYAGTGFLMSVNTMLTPLWLHDAIGFGVGGEIGFKVWDITADNGQITLKRYPALATAHTAIRMSDDWFLILAAGVEKDLGVELSGSGIASGIGSKATSNVAPVGRGMFYLRYSERAASMLGVILSRVRYRGANGSVDAGSLGVTLALGLAL
jgi:hypothetical protein